MLPNLTSQKVAIPAALFLALSPGVLVTTAGKNVKFMNGKTNQTAIFFHALVFFLVFSLTLLATLLDLSGDDSVGFFDKLFHGGVWLLLLEALEYLCGVGDWSLIRLGIELRVLVSRSEMVGYKENQAQAARMFQERKAAIPAGRCFL